MGYSHYFTQTQDCQPEQWIALCEAARKVIARNTDLVSLEYDEVDKPAEVSDDQIRFNGKGDDGHETFLLGRNSDRGFQFCKTAQKPYDVVVVAVLCLAHELCPGVWEISSDGNVDDWADGKALAESVLGREITMQTED